jgi:hypothetical protein
METKQQFGWSQLTAAIKKGQDVKIKSRSQVDLEIRIFIC